MPKQSDNPIRSVDTAWFKGLLADRKMPQRKLAKELGLDPAAVSLMLRGMRGMDVEEAATIAGVLRVSVEEVLRHAGVQQGVLGASGSVPVVGWINGSGNVVEAPPGGPKTVAAPPGAGEGAMALRVRSDGAWDGWLLFYQPVDGVSVDALGRLCVVRVGGELAVRVVARGYSPGRFNLKSWTGEFFEDAVLESAAPVLWMRQ